MKLLLDTHTLLWWFTDAPELSVKACEATADERQRILESGSKRLGAGDWCSEVLV